MPGVLQLRLAKGLRAYPRGQSAMLCYLVATEVRAQATMFCQARRAAGDPVEAWLCRHAVDFSGDRVMEAQRLHARLLAQFVSRFGSEPKLPCA